MEFLLFKEKYDDLKNRYDQISTYLDNSVIEKDINELKDKTLIEGFWDNKADASDILKQISKKESDLEFYNSVLSKYEDLCISYELSQMNQKVEDESIEILVDFSKILDQLEVKETLNQKDGTACGAYRVSCVRVASLFCTPRAQCLGVYITPNAVLV